MKYFLVSDLQLWAYRAAFTELGEIPTSQNAKKAYMAEVECMKIEVPSCAKGFYIVDENGDTKCFHFWVER